MRDGRWGWVVSSWLALLLLLLWCGCFGLGLPFCLLSCNHEREKHMEGRDGGVDRWRAVWCPVQQFAAAVAGHRIRVAGGRHRPVGSAPTCKRNDVVSIRPPAYVSGDPFSPPDAETAENCSFYIFIRIDELTLGLF